MATFASVNTYSEADGSLPYSGHLLCLSVNRDIRLFNPVLLLNGAATASVVCVNDGKWTAVFLSLMPKIVQLWVIFYKTRT